MADAMTETTAPETKVEEREYIALLPHAWGRDKNYPEVALMNAIKAFESSRRYLKKETTSLPFKVLEVTGDWEISDFDGSVTAKTIEDIAKGELPLALMKTIWDAFDQIDDLIQGA